ncbi:MAG TPA: 1,4-beta-xylanase [Planctomycetes bacterium]|nr:1,4-beta-xylanase [Planctomycetota bacterium]
MIAPVLFLAFWAAGQDEALAGSAERIRAHRTGDLVVTVVDAQGAPIAGAAVSVGQTRHDFLFGCNIFALGTFGEPAREEAYRARFKELLNFATLPFYWANYESARGEPQYERTAAMAAWCAANGIAVKGHPLVWNHPAGVPAWLPAAPEESHPLLTARVEACVSRFRGVVDMWDVVNEAADPYRFDEKLQIADLMKTIGVEKYLLDSFAAARKANPKARLLINDYRIDDAYARVIDMLAPGGARVYDCIGIQSHMHGGVWPASRVWNVCDRFARFGVPLHFTETTLVSGPHAQGGRWGPTEPALEERQARDTVMFYTAVFSHPATTALTWWDFSDARAWQGAAAGFLRKDCSPKPVYDALKKLIKGEWWTAAALSTDAAGKAAASAFFGSYAIAVRTPAGAEAKAAVEFPRPWPPPAIERARKEVTIVVPAP